MRTGEGGVREGERKEREMGVLKGWEVGETGGSYVTRLKINSNRKREKAKKKGGGSRDCKVREVGGLELSLSVFVICNL